MKENKMYMDQKEETKLSLLADDMFIYAENKKELTKISETNK
jgi:hypothetical protein